MKTHDNAIRDVDGQIRTDSLAAILDTTDINIAHANLEELQFVVSSALAFDRQELEQKVATINLISEKLIGAAAKVPLPLSTEVMDATVAVGQAVRSKVLGDMLKDVTKGMNDADEAMNVARIGMIKALYVEQRSIAKEYKDLAAEYETKDKLWRASPDKQVENYIELREMENKFAKARARLEAFETKVSLVIEGSAQALDKSKEIKKQGKDTGYQQPEKRMPEQHQLTQHMYKAAVIQYMKEKFKDLQTPTYLKREEVKMLEKAFPERFVEERTGVEWHKQSSEEDRAKMLIRLDQKQLIRNEIIAKGEVKLRVEKEEASSFFFEKKGDALKNKINEEIEKAVEKRYEELAIENLVVRRVNLRKVPSPLTGERVCQETADRHARLARAVESVEGVEADTTIKLNRLMVSGDTKYNIGAVLRQEEEKLFEADGSIKLFGASGSTLTNAVINDDPAIARDIEKAQMLQSALTEINAMANNSDDDKAQRFNKIEQFETKFHEKFGENAVDELSHFTPFQKLMDEKTAYLSNAIEAGIFSQLKVLDIASLDKCPSTADVLKTKTELLRQISDIEVQNQALQPNPSVVISEKISNLRSNVEQHATAKLGWFHEQAMVSVNAVEACRATDFSACIDAAKVAEIAANAKSLIASQEAKVQNYSKEDQAALRSKIADITGVIDAGAAAALKRIENELGQLDSKRSQVQEKVATLKTDLIEGRRMAHFNPDTSKAMANEVARLEQQLETLSGTPTEQSSQLNSIATRAEQCHGLFQTMKSTDYLKYDAIAKYPPVVQAALNRSRADMTLDQRVAEDHFAAAVIASYRLNPQIVQAEIDELSTHSHAQTRALLDYHAVHVFDDVTQENIGAKVDEMRTHLQNEIKRIEDKEPNPSEGSNTAKKLHLLKNEDTRLGALHDMVDNKVCFSSVQAFLGKVIDNVTAAAKIQRNFFHGGTTSTEDNLLGAGSKFRALKQSMHEQLQQKMDARNQTAANDGDGAKREDGDGEHRAAHM